IVSCVLSITGVDNIISFAYPILAFVYPIVITLVLYTIFFGPFIKDKIPYMAALAGSTVIAILSLFKHLNLLCVDAISILNHIPFFAYGLGWVVPSFILFVSGVLLSRKRKEAGD